VHGYPTRGPTGDEYILRPAVIFVNYVCTVKITQEFMRLLTPLIVIFTIAAPEPVYSNICGPLPEEVGRPWCNAELAQGQLLAQQ
jgi:hypothetical protein